MSQKKSNKICILYTETNGPHYSDENVSKKLLYSFARLVVLNYEIGYLDNNQFNSLINKRIIIKPRAMYIPEESVKNHGITNEIANDEGSEIEATLVNFLQDLKDVSIIISYNILFHIKTIQAECIRYNIQNNFTKFVIIDIISFFNKIRNSKEEYNLIELYNILLKKKQKNNKKKLEMIKLSFFQLYEEYNK